MVVSHSESILTIFFEGLQNAELVQFLNMELLRRAFMKSMDVGWCAGILAPPPLRGDDLVSFRDFVGQCFVAPVQGLWDVVSSISRA